MHKIPSVNLLDFLSGDEQRKQKFVNEIGKAYEDIGFVALKGHFLDDALVEQLYAQVKNFFDLPQEVKYTYEISGIGGQRGYTSFGKEKAKGNSARDLKEFWHFGQYLNADSPYKNHPHYHDNVIVSELPEFNSAGEQAYKMLEKTGIYVLRALAIYVNLNELYFDQYVLKVTVSSAPFTIPL